MSDGTQEMPSEPPLTATDVGRILGKHRKRVLEIPEDELPYRATRGGPERGGRRYYRLADVEAYLNRPDRLTAVERDVADLKQWRAAHEQNHPQ